MRLGQRLRALRNKKKLSLGDIEKRVGLLRTYVSRVERGCTTPSVETLEKLACALHVPMYEIFCTGSRPNRHTRRFPRSRTWGATPAESRDFDRMRRLLVRIKDSDRDLLLSTAQQMAREL